MRLRGLVIGLLLALVAVYFIYFTKVTDDGAGGLRVMVDQYLEAKVDLTRANLETLSREILAFASDGEALPATLEALRRFSPTAGAVPDAWGRRIRYERLSEDSFRLRSAGPDGTFETDDDIVKDF
jgi:hypothetical protein